MSGPANDDERPTSAFIFEVVGDDGDVVGGLTVDEAGAFQWLFEDDVPRAARMTSIVELLQGQMRGIQGDLILNVMTAAIIRTLRGMTDDVGQQQAAFDLVREGVMKRLTE